MCMCISILCDSLECGVSEGEGALKKGMLREDNPVKIFKKTAKTTTTSNTPKKKQTNKKQQF